ncbi:hypothetical protein [Paenibacillus sp. Z6-24]
MQEPKDLSRMLRSIWSEHDPHSAAQDGIDIFLNMTACTMAECG